MLVRLASTESAARWLRERSSGELHTDSRRVRPGDAFIAWPGQAHDGRRFVAGALAAGAAGCLVEAEGVESCGFDDARIGALPALKAAAGGIADLYYGRPSAALRLLAVTGTNGKTSTAWWIAQALALLGRRCGVVGTLGIGEPPRVQATGLTTPDPVLLHGALRRMVDEGFEACAIEASSIGIEEHRLGGLQIEVAILTNFTRDHLDYHGSMAAYWAAKRKLFGWPGLAAAVINLDDAQGAALAAELAAGAERPALWTCSLRRTDARLHAEALRHADGGLAFEVHEGAESHTVQSRLIGDYNAQNLLAVIGGLRALGVPLADAVRVLPRLAPVPGRLQRVAAGEGGPEVVVDYAHTPDALEQVLVALRPLARARGGRLVCVFGCGGDRDASKRPLMGAIAERLADRVVLTSDNPRSEPPTAILTEIGAGLVAPGAARVIEDRAEAIAEAIAAAQASDLLLIAGKGHEDYQEVAGVKRPFSDVAEAERALQARRAS